MDRPRRYTQSEITRAIKAAMKAGLKVRGVRPDGTVLTEISGEQKARELYWTDHDVADAERRANLSEMSQSAASK